MALSSGTRVGPYEIVAPLGAGGMGEVYRARDTKLQREVALKILPDLFASDPDRLARFSREAQTLASLNHPHIAQVYGVEEQAEGSGSSRAIIMELVEGETLAERIAQGPLALDEALPIARQIAEALQAAHEAGIVHRDLKPANIKLRADGTVKVLDFGLARAGRTSGAGATDALNSPTLTSPAMTAAGLILGTAAYMAPEQAKGRAVDKRADVWGFGCVLFEMLTARRPFEGDDVSDLLATVLKSDPDWTLMPASVPVPIQTLIRRCLEKDPRRRVADLAVARFVLDEPLIAGAATAATPSPTTPTGKRRMLTAAGFSVAAVAVAAAAGWVTLTLTSRPALPVRFAIVPATTEPFAPTGNDRDLAITPNGREVVYRVSVNGPSRLAVRSLDRLDARLLEGTEAARSPIMSPDGQWVAFQSAGTLKKVPIAGGAPVTLCRLPATLRGGTWHGQNIVFATIDPSTGLLSVPATGGEPTVLTTPDLSRGEGDHFFPSFLPDGRSLLFTIVPTTGATGALQVAALDLTTGERKLLLANATQPQFVAPGALLFRASAALRAVRFDPGRAEVQSEPVPVLEQVGSMLSGAANFAVSPEGTLVYVPGTGGQDEVRRTLMWVSRDGREEPLLGEGRSFVDPRLSPDEKRVVVEINDESDDIWMLDVSRGALTRHTFEPGEDETPLWMPDGTHIVYASTRADTPRAIYRRRADGSGPEEALWKGREHVHVESVTPDGRALLLTSTEVNGAQTDLLLLPLDGSGAMKPLIQTRFSERNPQLSPDGRWLAYASDETGRDEVYVQAFPSLQGKMQVSTAGGDRAVWSRRGDELIFRSGRQFMTVAVKAGTELALGDPRALFPDTYSTKGGGHIPFDIARDGRLLMVKDGEAQLASGTPASLVVVLHWFEELKARLK